MAIGIWTQNGLTEQVLFDTLPIPGNMITTIKSVTAKAGGSHLLIINESCEPVFFSLVAPATPAAGVQGVPILPGAKYVVPNPAAVSYIYNPYSIAAVYVAPGTMT